MDQTTNKVSEIEKYLLNLDIKRLREIHDELETKEKQLIREISKIEIDKSEMAEELLLRRFRKNTQGRNRIEKDTGKIYSLYSNVKDPFYKKNRIFVEACATDTFCDFSIKHMELKPCVNKSSDTHSALLVAMEEKLHAETGEEKYMSDALPEVHTYVCKLIKAKDSENGEGCYLVVADPYSVITTEPTLYYTAQELEPFEGKYIILKAVTNSIIYHPLTIEIAPFEIEK